eukprot:6458517-Amphidinium_carterae.1
MVGPKLRDRPEARPRVRLPAPTEAEIEVPPLAGPGEALTQAPHVEGPHRRVVTVPGLSPADGKGAGEV